MATGKKRRGGVLAVIGPGLLVAATGVGAGDLATAGFSGATLGLAVAWAVVVGAALKFAITEGVARWQIATGTTVLEGVSEWLGPVARWLFLLYLLPWSVFVGAALVSACGAAAAAMVPWPGDPEVAKRVWGVAHSAVGVGLVLAGGFRLFERVMAASIAVMFAAVVVSAVMLRPDVGELVRGLVVPTVPRVDGALGWTVALIGGVGGTVTVLCYGYWIREEGRDGPDGLPMARLDLLVGYTMTGLFGVAMLVIASGVGPVDGKGVGLIVGLADRLGEALGAWARWVFLVGAWAAVFSSLLGVWQAVPYLFADWVRTGEEKGGDARRSCSGLAGVELEKTAAYRVFLLALATVPCAGLFVSFASVQKLYAVFGATFVPMLAVALLVLNGRRAWVGEKRNGVVATGALVLVLVFFGWVAVRAVG